MRCEMEDGRCEMEKGGLHNPKFKGVEFDPFL